jgi:hypothetical protein
MNEVIYIPDDDDEEDEEAAMTRHRRRRGSSTSSEIEYITSPPAHSHRKARRPDSSTDLVQDDDFSGTNFEVDSDLLFGFDQSLYESPLLPADPVDHRLACIDQVIVLFPDICRDYVSELYDAGDNQINQTAERLIELILDKGTEYPKPKDKLNSRKRNFQTFTQEEDQEAQKYESMDRGEANTDYAMITFVIHLPLWHVPIY